MSRVLKNDTRVAADLNSGRCDMILVISTVVILPFP